MIYCPICKEKYKYTHFIQDDPILTCGHRIAADLWVKCRSKEVEERMDKYLEQGYNLSDAINAVIEEHKWHPYETR